MGAQIAPTELREMARSTKPNRRIIQSLAGDIEVQLQEQHRRSAMEMEVATHHQGRLDSQQDQVHRDIRTLGGK